MLTPSRVLSPQPYGRQVEPAPSPRYMGWPAGAHRQAAAGSIPQAQAQHVGQAMAGVTNPTPASNKTPKLRSSSAQAKQISAEALLLLGFKVRPEDSKGRQQIETLNKSAELPKSSARSNTMSHRVGGSGIIEKHRLGAAIEKGVQDIRGGQQTSAEAVTSIPSDKAAVVRRFAEALKSFTGTQEVEISKSPQTKTATTAINTTPKLSSSSAQAQASSAEALLHLGFKVAETRKEFQKIATVGVEKRTINGALVKETLAEAREEFEKGGTIMVEKPTINGVLVLDLLPKARPQEISEKGNNLVRADGSSEPFSKGQCGCCGYDVMSDQTRFSDHDSYYHQECWQELVATVEAVKKSMHEKRARKRIEAAVARGLDSDSILTPNANRSSSYTQSVCKKVQRSYGTIAEREDGDEDDEGEHGSELLELKRVFMEKARPEKTKFTAHLAYPMPPLKNPPTVNSGTIMVANVANETSTQGIQQTKDQRQKDRFSAPHLGYPNPKPKTPKP